METNYNSINHEVLMTQQMRRKINWYLSKTIAIYIGIVFICFIIPVIVGYVRNDIREGITSGLGLALILCAAFFSKIKIRGKCKLYEVVCEGKTLSYDYSTDIGDSGSLNSRQKEVYMISYHLDGVQKHTNMDERMYNNVQVGDLFYVVVYPGSQFKYVLEHNFFD